MTYRLVRRVRIDLLIATYMHARNLEFKTKEPEMTEVQRTCPHVRTRDWPNQYGVSTKCLACGWRVAYVPHVTKKDSKSSSSTAAPLKELATAVKEVSSVLLMGLKKLRVVVVLIRYLVRLLIRLDDVADLVVLMDE